MSTRRSTTIIKQVAEEQGFEQHAFTDEEVLHRLLFSSINEICKILEEGKAIRASDLDVMWLNGFGFPRYRGGPMYWGDTIGALNIYNQVAAWHQKFGDRWRPSELLRRTAEAGDKLQRHQSRYKALGRSRCCSGDQGSPGTSAGAGLRPGSRLLPDGVAVDGASDGVAVDGRQLPLTDAGVL